MKGSTVDREASDKEKEKDLPTLKDNDFVKEGLKIHIGETAKEKLLETLNADVEVSFQIFLYNLPGPIEPTRFVLRAEELWVPTTSSFPNQRGLIRLAIKPRSLQSERPIS